MVILQGGDRDRKSVTSAPADADGGREPGRFSARRKTGTIQRLLCGEPLDSVARELGVTAATLAQWREQFLAGRPGGAQEPAGGRTGTTRYRLRAKVGEITMTWSQCGKASTPSSGALTMARNMSDA